MKQLRPLIELITGKLEKELPANLTYHNVDHTRDVMKAAAILGEMEHIDAYENQLLQTAALFHDSGFLKTREGHEAASCAFARHYLPDYNFDNDEIEVICSMIMATQLPQSPRNHLEEILCDADLDYLGRDDFFALSDKLFTELHAECIIKDLDGWNREQADFLSDHHYFSEASVNLRQQKKEQHIKFIKLKISTQVADEK